MYGFYINIEFNIRVINQIRSAGTISIINQLK